MARDPRSPPTISPMVVHPSRFSRFRWLAEIGSIGVNRARPRKNGVVVSKRRYSKRWPSYGGVINVNATDFTSRAAPWTQTRNLPTEKKKKKTLTLTVENRRGTDFPGYCLRQRIPNERGTLVAHKLGTLSDCGWLFTNRNNNITNNRSSFDARFGRCHYYGSDFHALRAIKICDIKCAFKIKQKHSIKNTPTIFDVNCGHVTILKTRNYEITTVDDLCG